jgi:NADH-quinone oxidoreductase subunit H
MKFALFFLGEYTHVIMMSFLTSILFFGGWHFPWIATPDSAYAGAWVVKLMVLLTKVFAVIVFIMLIRWTIPRFRFDQLMNLSWKALMPLALANVLAVMIVLQLGWDRWLLGPISIALFLIAGIIGVSVKQAEIRHRPSAAELRQSLAT